MLHPQCQHPPLPRCASVVHSRFDLLDLIKQKLVSLDTTRSLPLPAALAAAALSYSRGELVVRCIF